MKMRLDHPQIGTGSSYLTINPVDADDIPVWMTTPGHPFTDPATAWVERDRAARARH